MSVRPRDQLLNLHRLLDSERPPREPGLRNDPPEPTVDRIIGALTFDPDSEEKFLLVGPLGCGKSTELRAVAERLAGKRTVVDIDLDASGVDATSVSAFDLLYVASLGILRHVTEGRKALFTKLADAYRRSEPPGTLGTVEEALGGLAGFAGSAGELATTLGGVPGGGLAIAGALSTAKLGLRLIRTASPAVEASSGPGRALQEAARAIARAVDRDTPGPLIVLVDGLEKMNGEAADRFRQVFQHTRLLSDAPWPAVIAAPPASMTVVSSVDAVGFRALPVYGFGVDGDGPERLRTALERRFTHAGVKVDGGAREALAQIAAGSGGFPRHAVRMTRFAVEHAAEGGKDSIDVADAEFGIREVAKELARTLLEEHWGVLERVHASGNLPDSEEAAQLYAHARILALRPRGDQVRTTFVVHPSLVQELKPRRPRKGTG